MNKKIPVAVLSLVSLLSTNEFANAASSDFQTYNSIVGQCHRMFRSEKAVFNEFRDLIMKRMGYSKHPVERIAPFKSSVVFEKYPGLKKVSGFRSAVRRAEGSFYELQAELLVQGKIDRFDPADALVTLASINKFLDGMPLDTRTLVEIVTKQGKFKDLDFQDFADLYGNTEIQKVRALYVGMDAQYWYPLHFSKFFAGNAPKKLNLLEEIYDKAYLTEAWKKNPFFTHVGSGVSAFSSVAVEKELANTLDTLVRGSEGKDFKQVTESLTRIYGTLAGLSWVDTFVKGAQPDRAGVHELMRKFEPEIQAAFRGKQDALERYFLQSFNADAAQILAQLKALEVHLKVNGSSLGIDLEAMKLRKL